MPVRMPLCLQLRDGLAHLRDGDAALHGVEHALRAALRADPDAVAAELGQLRGHARRSGGRRA